jgi:HAD superfamily hydrolase (TIGR01662 family)
MNMTTKNKRGYTPEMLKAKRMKNRYLPPNFPVVRKDGRKYLFLDFDNTVRHTIPDPKPDEPLRRRPPHKAEEVYMIHGMREKVRDWADAGYFVIGLTNQSNIESGFNTTADVVSAIKKTLDGLGMQFPVYFASHKNKSLPDYDFRKPMTGMIDAAIRDFGSPNRTYSVMVGDDWEGADSGMARNAGVHFIGVMPFLNMTVEQGEHQLYVMTKANDRLELLNPDDLIRTFADQYDEILGVASYSAESSYSKSPSFKTGRNMAMKMSMGTILGVVGGLLLGYNAPSLWDKFMGKESSAAEKAVESEQSLANQGFMEDWVGGNEGDDNLVSEGNQPTPPAITYSYDPLASGNATDYDPATRPPSMI